MKFNRLGITLAAGMAMVVLSALATTAAQAAGGPLWIVGAGGTSLASGETRAITSRNEGVYKLVGAVTVECSEVTNTGFLLGGNPGTDYTKIVFTKCHLEGKPNCSATGLKPLAAANEAEVIVDALTVLAYPKGGAEGESALDAFAPEGEAANPNLFVEFELKNLPGTTECGAILNKLKVRVEAVGTEITIKSEKRKCGQLSEVGTEKGGTFFLSKPGEVAEVGLLRLPEPAVTEAELWNGTAFEKIKCELKADGAAAHEVGTSQIETNPKEPFGWDK